MAVRVRPFNARETARNALNIVEMSGKSTKITNPQVKGGSVVDRSVAVPGSIPILGFHRHFAGTKPEMNFYSYYRLYENRR